MIRKNSLKLLARSLLHRCYLLLLQKQLSPKADSYEVKSDFAANFKAMLLLFSN